MVVVSRLHSLQGRIPQSGNLHGKYGKEGLVCISCSVDSVEDHARHCKFLKKAKATFPNYRIHFKENEEWAGPL